MTYLTFDVGVMMGKCDGCNISIEYDVSDEEYEALKKAEEDGTYFDDLKNNPILYKLYSNLYDQAADEVDESEEYYEDEDENEDENEGRFIDMFTITIHFPNLDLEDKDD